MIIFPILLLLQIETGIMGNQIHLACWRDDCEILEKLRGNITPDDFKRP